MPIVKHVIKDFSKARSVTIWNTHRHYSLFSDTLQWELSRNLLWCAICAEQTVQVKYKQKTIISTACNSLVVIKNRKSIKEGRKAKLRGSLFWYEGHLLRSKIIRCNYLQKQIKISSESKTWTVSSGAGKFIKRWNFHLWRKFRICNHHPITTCANCPP